MHRYIIKSEKGAHTTYHAWYGRNELKSESLKLFAQGYRLYIIRIVNGELSWNEYEADEFGKSYQKRLRVLAEQPPR